MPTWTFREKIDGAQYDKFFKSYNDMQAWLAEHPEVEQIPGRIAPPAIDPIRAGITKPTQEFRERMKEIKTYHDKKYTKSTINEW